MEEENKLSHCSFCGTNKEFVKKLIVGDGIAICSDCVELCNELIADDSKIESSEPSPNYDPESIKIASKRPRTIMDSVLERLNK